MTDVAADVASTPAVPLRRGVLGLILRNPLALSGLVVLVLMVLVALFAGLLAPMDPLQPELRSRNAPPGTPGHPLGADGAGRDILSRLIYGTRLTLLGAALAVVVAVAVGVPAGLLAGYYGGWFDGVASWLADVGFSVPGKVVLLAVISAFGPSVLITMTAFGVILAPGMFRLVRSQTIGVRNDLYVDAARVAGLSDLRIMARHIFYVVRAPVIIQGSILAGIAIIVQSGLDFLGLGDQSQVTWGSMLGNAFAVIYLAPTAMVWPGIAIGLVVASLVLLGNGLRDAVQGTSTVRRRRRGAAPARQPAEGRPAAEAVPVGGADGVDAVLEVRGLRIGYPQADGETIVVVHDVDLTVRRGDVLGLVGESGSGKTQTAFAVLGLLPQGGEVLGGSITVDGTDVLDLPGPARRQLLGSKIAYVPQEPMSNLDPAFRVGQQLVEPLRAAGLSRSEARTRALELLADVGIPDPDRTFRSYPHQISGGMAQRVLIAGAIAGDPVLLIADEPTTALDVTVQAEVLSLLRRLQRERNMAVLLVTHNFGVVADLCDSVAVMQSGRIVESSSVREIFATPQHPYTRMLLEANLDDTEPRAPLRPAVPPVAAARESS
ncbi:dipeptide/oligopeptide/nickel ABC transporter permease/ATP-binding protein [Nocardioides coralli]|uniref:dipeptide/oligopeptide/nickel ABC transporter permease/ATP-binding protein n=1 Tax=Nocardioides coralli TaxID=2872154 RepID=UPI001CA3E52F|nr:dipeptide/oligopeptide/nickel ABC transporter permease/ATP-binding protein [Nocardioides coralli]QZY30454.1 dipeptide/oligopeptide/nickel ABC transporter permease/ATP-binding protein [Nocardioides coralli]